MTRHPALALLGLTALLTPAGASSLSMPTTATAQASSASSTTTTVPCDEAALRGALGSSGAVAFGQDCALTLTAPLTITTGVSVSLDGAGYRVTLDGGHATQLFVVQDGATLTLDGLTLAHGSADNVAGVAPSAAFGGAINNAGRLTILRDTLVGNGAWGQQGVAGLAAGGGAAGLGGAIYSGGGDSTLTIANSTLVSRVHLKIVDSGGGWL